MNIEKRYNTYYVTDEDVDKPIKLPSQLFPIKTTPICHFFQSNTVDCDDETMLVAYDNVEPLIGQCYTNTKKLIDTAVTAGIPKNKIVPYVGWVFTSGIYPIHHCFAVYNGESVFDFISDIKLQDIEAMENMSLDDARMQMAKICLERKHLPNREKYGKGKLEGHYFYIGAPCSPEAGLKEFVKLQKSHPNHPSYRSGGNMFGPSKTQQLILDALCEKFTN